MDEEENNSPMGVSHDEEIMTEQQPPQPTAAEANHTSDQPANTRSRTTSILIALIAVSVVAIVALTLALTKPFSGRSKSTDSANEIITAPPSSSFPSFSPSSRPSTIIPNWDLTFLGTDTDFSIGSTNEITFKYEIGAGRTYEFALFAPGCMDDVIGLNYNTTTVTNAASAVTDNLDVLLDVESVSNIRESNIWSDITSRIEMCIALELVSPTMVVKRDTRNIAINLVNVGVFG